MTTTEQINRLESSEIVLKQLSATNNSVNVNKCGMLFFLLILFSLVCCKSVAQVVTDIDGNVYNTVSIGSQVWLKENLKATHYNNGDTIFNITNNSEWASLNTPAYCWYNNDFNNYGEVYGALYNWFTVDTASNGNNNPCPIGWHVPTTDDWTTLTTFLGGESISGGKMKEAGTEHWSAPNTAATNESGFTALPGGYRGYVNGTFNYINAFGHWWSSTEFDASLAWGRGLFYLDASINNSTSVKKNGFCIRCVNNQIDHINLELDIESSFVLHQNYPNPFNPSTVINYQLPANALVVLKIFDILGRDVETLVDERESAGHHSVRFSATNVLSGVYFYRLQAGTFTATKRLSVIK